MVDEEVEHGSSLSWLEATDALNAIMSYDLGLSGLSPIAKQLRLQNLGRRMMPHPPSVPPWDEREALHQALEQLAISDYKARALVHALIDLGRVTKLECQHPRCKLPGVPFFNDTIREPRELSIDHIIQRHSGGDDRPENLRIVHDKCNLGWSAGLIRENMRGRPSPLKGTKISKETREKLSLAHRGKRLSDAHRQAVSDALRNRPPNVPVRCDGCGMIFRGKQGLGVHVARSATCDGREK